MSDRKRINGEIWGRCAFKVVNDKLIPAVGGCEVGSPIAKRSAKKMASRLRRLNDQKITKQAVEAAQ